MGIAYNPRIVTDGLVLCLDAANPKSYPGTGTTWFDLSGQSAHGTLNGTVSYVNSGPQSYFNFATVSNSNFISSSVSQNYVDMCIVFQPDFTLVTETGLTGLIGTNTPESRVDKSLRFPGADGTGPWNLASRNPGDANDWAHPSATTYRVNGIVSNTLVSGWNMLSGFRTNQTTFPASFSYCLGSSSFPERSFQGKIAYVAFYNRALTAEEVAQNFNALKGRYAA